MYMEEIYSGIMRDTGPAYEISPVVIHKSVVTNSTAVATQAVGISTLDLLLNKAF